MRVGLRSLAALPALLMGLTAAPLLACPLCMSASTPGTRLGYYVSTAILSLTPLLIMALMGSYIAYKYSRQDRWRRNRVDASSQH